MKAAKRASQIKGFMRFSFFQTGSQVKEETIFYNMAAPKNKSIPRRLKLLAAMAASVTVAAAALYYFTTSKTFKDSAAMTTQTMAKLNRSYELLERISGDMRSEEHTSELQSPMY